MNILILGAGLVAKPMVDFFLTRNYSITLADIDISKAMNLLGQHPNGKAIALDAVNDEVKLDELIRVHDIVVTLLPPNFTPMVATHCITNKKNLVSTNYVSPETKKLDLLAKESGVTIICEVGVDPGIDHMIAKQIIDETHNASGKVLSFKSYCGGLPAPDSNNNPFGYKFSWSPRGVLLASKRSAQYQEQNNIITIPEGDVFSKGNISYLPVDNSIGSLEVYANSDSTKYKEVYDIPEAETIFRSTLRYPGWSETIYALQNLHYLSLDEKNANCTYSEYLSTLIDSSNNNIRLETANYLGLPEESEIIKRMDWLGLFSTNKIQTKKQKIAPLDLLTAIMFTKMTYSEKENDLLVLINEFVIQNPDGSKEIIKASLIEYGDKNYSAMAKTVSYTASFATELLINGIVKQKGIVIPTEKEIYSQILKGLAKLGLKINIEKKIIT